MSQDYTVVCLSEAISPITHMSRSEGNESLVAREPVVTPRGVGWVPVLSGNAIRHRCVREPGMRWLIAQYGLSGKLTLAQLNFLLHGGNLTQGGGRENTRRIAEWQRLFPLGRLLGGCLPDQVLAGSLQCWRGTLVCEENRPWLALVLNGCMPEERLRPAESFVSEYQYTRGDASKTAADLHPTDAGEDVNSQLMIMGGQLVLSGAVFVHGFTMPHVGSVELGALLWSLSLWQAQGGTIGGQGARGHGRLKMSVLADGGETDYQAAIDEYLGYTRSTRDEAVAWLEAVFTPRAETAAANGDAPPTRRRRGRPHDPPAPGHRGMAGPLAGDAPWLDGLLLYVLALHHRKYEAGYKIDRARRRTAPGRDPDSAPAAGCRAVESGGLLRPDLCAARLRGSRAHRQEDRGGTCWAAGP